MLSSITTWNIFPKNFKWFYVLATNNLTFLKYTARTKRGMNLSLFKPFSRFLKHVESLKSYNGGHEEKNQYSKKYLI